MKGKVILAFLLLSQFVFAQQSHLPLQYWNDVPRYMAVQDSLLLLAIDKAMDARPPVVSHGEQDAARQLILCSLDAFLHTPRPDTTAAFRDFVDSRMGKVLQDLERPLRGKVRIYKIYNDGFIVRTRKATVAVDLNGREGRFVPAARLRALSAHCDALLVTHRHPDHLDRIVVEAFLEAGKPVCMPEDAWVDDSRILHLDGGVHPLAGVQVRVLPGHQDETPTRAIRNNIYQLTFPGGFTVTHTGDQAHQTDLDWIGRLSGTLPPSDVLLMDGWTPSMEQFVSAFAPRLILSGHENEMGHSTGHREAFWLSDYKLRQVIRPDCPFSVLGWGEWIDCR